VTSHRFCVPVAAALLSLVLLAAAQTPVPASGQPLTALPYSPSFDLRSLDRGTDPCVDFYRFSCGGWEQNHPIPADQDSWSVYAKLHEDNLRFLWGLLIEAAATRPGRTPSEQKTGDYFAACMDQPAINAAGLAPVRRTLDRIDGLRSVKELAPLVAGLHLSGAGGPMFGFGSEQDFGDSSRIVGFADAGGLGLPDRDQYLETDARSREIRQAYRAHIARVLELAGHDRPAAEAAARSVIAMETQLARASLSRVQRRDARKLYHLMTTEQLRRLMPAFDWKAYLGTSAVSTGQLVNVAEPGFFRRLDGLLVSHSLADWKTYLRWHTLNAHAPYLHAALARADFEFHSTFLLGVEAMPPRWRQCVRWVDRDLGEALGEVFVQRTFAPETKQRAAEMAERIRHAMHQRIQNLDWMGPKTKQEAFDKLRTLVNKIGYPERWRDYGALEIRRDDFFGNVQRGQGFEARRQLAKIGRPVDRSEWGMTPPTVNAYYNALMNDMNFPAGILQPPLFDPKMDDAPNYGNTGSTIGHELTHGFDDEGRRFDARGNLRDWWTARDAAEFEQRTACVVQQYSGYTVVDDVKINGRLTVGEDVADLGGTVLAYVAWTAATAGKELAPIDGFTPDQRFFVGMAQWACSNERPQALRLRALTDPHSPPRHRVNGVVSNLPEFARAFACKPGQPMVRRKPCKVW